MLKHVGKHNDRRIVILFRQVPNEEHMALVAYSDALPSMIHDEVMKVLESEIGQQAKELSDALFRSLLPDGRNALESLHREGFIKKVPTSQILVTPTNSSSVRLDELNNILNEMARGEDAIKRLADLDQNQGLITRKRAEPREVGTPDGNRVSRTGAAVEGTVSAAALLGNDGVLSDADLAAQRTAQAAAMKMQAQQMLAEAQRLEQEAQQLSPVKNDSKPAKATKKASSKKQEA